MFAADTRRSNKGVIQNGLAVGLILALEDSQLVALIVTRNELVELIQYRLNHEVVVDFSRDDFVPMMQGQRNSGVLEVGVHFFDELLEFVESNEVGHDFLSRLVKRD